MSENAKKVGPGGRRTLAKRFRVSCANRYTTEPWYCIRYTKASISTLDCSARHRYPNLKVNSFLFPVVQVKHLDFSSSRLDSTRFRIRRHFDFDLIFNPEPRASLRVLARLRFWRQDIHRPNHHVLRERRDEGVKYTSLYSHPQVSSPQPSPTRPARDTSPAIFSPHSQGSAHPTPTPVVID